MYVCVCVSGQGEALSLNATMDLSTSYYLQEENLEEGGYGEEGYEAAEGGFSLEEEEYGQMSMENADEYREAEGGMTEEGMNYSTGMNEGTYEDEVLELQIDEPLDDEFQVSVPNFHH